MVFSSLFFVFVFLVLCYIFYTLAPSIKAKNVVLLISSLIFYSWGGAALSILLCTMTLICYLGAIAIKDTKRPKAAMVTTVALCIGILAFFKYTTFILSNTHAIFGFPTVIPKIILPLGISFYTFQLISYVVDVYRGEVEPQREYWLLLLYSSLFSQCIAGPIVRYSDVAREITSRRVTLAGTSRGITRFAVGLAKKAVVANYCGYIAESILPKSLESASALTLILSSVFYMIQIYLDFSAYSDMAIGMGLMTGFHFCENFNYPYIASSVTEFWRRWHMSLSSFFRDYVYIPLGGSRCSTARNIFNIFVVWFLTGLWHGAGWNYMIWGLFFFVFLVLERYILKITKAPRCQLSYALRRVYLLVVVFFSFIIFRFEDMGKLGRVLSGIFCLNSNPFFDRAALLALKNNCFFIIVALLACTPIIPMLHKKLKELSRSSLAFSRITVVLEAALPTVLLVLSLFSLAGDSYNPFMYRIF